MGNQVIFITVVTRDGFKIRGIQMPLAMVTSLLSFCSWLYWGRHHSQPEASKGRKLGARILHHCVDISLTWAPSLYIFQCSSLYSSHPLLPALCLSGALLEELVLVRLQTWCSAVVISTDSRARLLGFESEPKEIV